MIILYVTLFFTGDMPKYTSNFLYTHVWTPFIFLSSWSSLSFYDWIQVESSADNIIVIITMRSGGTSAD